MAHLPEWLFGVGWWRLWHGFLWLCLASAGWLAWWAARVLVPGTGPQGGEAMFALAALTLLALGVATLVDAVLLGAAVDGPWWLRRLAVPLGGLAAFVLALLMLLALVEVLADDAAGVGCSVLGVVAAIVALNLWALARCRAR
ncbi:MAG: hypothetical protein IT561_00330 [Alphaproteobacteria bacterium]|nr:hypothetical protein [Alphaproteobacteria bacterium]